MNYRQIGQALADHINQSSGVPTGAALQGMIADLAADQPALLPMGIWSHGQPLSRFLQKLIAAAGCVDQ